MDRTLISFNLPNMITVSIMAFAGYTLLALLSQIFKQGGLNLGSGGGAF